MKRVLALFLSFTMLLTGCASNIGTYASNVNESPESVSSRSDEDTIVSSEAETAESVPIESVSATTATADNSSVSLSLESHGNVNNLNFLTLNDPDLLQYVQDTVFSELVYQLNSDDYIIENVQAIYMPEEYFAAVEYNTKENIYFGYTSSELDEVFQGTKYIFTLDEYGQTTVQAMETLNDDTYNQIVKNVAIGAGVILVCVTVSVVSAGVGAKAVSAVFAASAKTAKTFALSSAALGGLSAAFIKGIETRNVKETIKAATLGASEGFKCGAVTGAVVGGASKGYKLFKAWKNLENAISSGSSIEIGRAAEEYALELYKGESQISYLAGKEVPQSTPGATRPDIVIKKPGGSIEAIEVKDYDLKNNLSKLIHELKRQVRDRKVNLPAGSTQRIALVTKGRGYSREFLKTVVEELQSSLYDIYGSNIPIDIL